MAINVLQINTADTKGGAGQVAYSLQNELKKQGHNSTLLVSRKYSKDNDVRLIRSDSNLKRRILKKLTYYLADDLDFFPAGHVLKMPEFESADIVHCHNLHTNYFNLSTLAKISAIKPVVWTFHDMWPVTAHCAHSFDDSTSSSQGGIKENGFFTCPSLEIYPPIAWHNEKYLEHKKTKIYSNSSFHIVTPSKWLAEKVKISLLKDKPITVIYNGIDTNIFRPLSKEACRHELELPLNKKTVLVVAKHSQLNPWKGGNYSKEIINAHRNNDEVYFVDLGGDENKTEENIRTVSYVNDKETLAKYYSAADVLLYPSIADNCPLVVLEAQSCGLPVVSFNTGGIPELVEHKKTGYVVEYKNLTELKAGLAYVLNLPPNEKTAMDKYASDQAAKNFSSQKTAENYINLYKEIIRN